MWDYDRLGPSEVLGSVVVGWNENGSKSVSADTHWQQMIENPRRPVVYWHRLKVISTLSVKVMSGDFLSLFGPFYMVLRPLVCFLMTYNTG